MNAVAKEQNRIQIGHLKVEKDTSEATLRSSSNLSKIRGVRNGRGTGERETEGGRGDWMGVDEERCE